MKIKFTSQITPNCKLIIPGKGMSSACEYMSICVSVKKWQNHLQHSKCKNKCFKSLTIRVPRCVIGDTHLKPHTSTLTVRWNCLSYLIEFKWKSVKYRKQEAAAVKQEDKIRERWDVTGLDEGWGQQDTR